MRYEKPTVVTLGSALRAIQSGECSKGQPHADRSQCGSSAQESNNTAYEADE
jgi:hypothetical protein